MTNGINRERLALLLERIKKCPDEEFDYTNWFSLEISPEDHIPEYQGPINLYGARANDVIRKAAKTNGPPACKTAACVAGHCCLLFWEEYKHKFAMEGFEATATHILNLDFDTSTSLFHDYMMEATREDAIKRLEHLMIFDDFETYDWTAESHMAKGDA